MLPLAILSSRKRAFVALIHAAAFLSLAIRDLVVCARLSGLLSASSGTMRSGIFAAIYLAVCVVLVYLARLSKPAVEQVYFACCAASAGTGLLRAVAGDAAFPAGQYLRIALLSAAVVTGILILKVLSSQAIPVSECAAPAKGMQL